MKTFSTSRALSVALVCCGCVASATGLVTAGRAAASEPALLRFDDLQWRSVLNEQGEELGGVSDILVQMPSGRLVFVAVDPSDLFQRPKAVPPHALRLPKSKDAPLVLDMSKERWIEAPRLDWDGALVIKNTEEGGRIYGYYQQAWREPDAGPPWGMTIVAPPKGVAPAARYVSLKNLLLERVETNGRQQAGYLRGFLIDWSAKRATHALVSSQFTPLGRPEGKWFAIPIPLLNPSVEDDTLTVNGSVDAFRTAPNWPASGKTTATDVTTIYRYPALPSAVHGSGSKVSR